VAGGLDHLYSQRASFSIEKRRQVMRKIADCRRFESESNCSLTIIGEEDEVVVAAAEHAASVHGHTDGPELREQVRAMLESEDSYVAGRREPEPFPG
jgi:predicted small metal-binding protein